ncbi:D-alanine--D-alanine ligase [Nakamurella silvestris]|nr:D-alanine--D-alanine ligase [Nakamurella silvestris]
MSEKRVRVAVVFGGRSGEHPVSCSSAASVLGHLDRDRFEVLAVGITTDGSWVQVPEGTPLAITAGALPEVPPGPALVLPADPTSSALVPLRGPAAVLSAADGSEVEPTADLDVDVVFPVLHGPYGEDGTIQGLLELADLPYVGAGVLASAAGMDKEFTKKLLAAEGLPVGEYVVLRPRQATLTDADKEHLGLPVFVKPARAGSSLGVSRVDRWEDLDEAIALARQADPKVLVERGVIGREIECGVLEFPDGRIEASPTAEIHIGADFSFYDFTAKYLDDAATFDIPALVPDEVTEQVRALAVRAFDALDAQGLARVDFFVTEAGEVIINEVNTMPGFTPISMFPRMWQAGGLSYPELLTVMVETAMARGTGLR